MTHPPPAMTSPREIEQREAIERDIRIAIWNGARWQGSPQAVAQSLIRKIMEEPTMARALASIEAALRSTGGEGWEPIESAPFGGEGFLACNAEEYDGIEWLIWQSREDEAHKFFNVNSGNYTRASHWTHWRPLPAPPVSDTGERG